MSDALEYHEGTVSEEEPPPIFHSPTTSVAWQGQNRAENLGETHRVRRRHSIGINAEKIKIMANRCHKCHHYEWIITRNCQQVQIFRAYRHRRRIQARNALAYRTGNVSNRKIQANLEIQEHKALHKSQTGEICK